MQGHPHPGQSSAKKQKRKQQVRLQGHSEQMAAVASTIAISLASKSNNLELETLVNLFSLITQTLRLILAQRAVDGKSDLSDTIIL